MLQSITVSRDESALVTVHKVFNEADIRPIFAFVDHDSVLRVCESIPARGGNQCWSIAGPGTQANHSMSTSLGTRDIGYDDFDLFERDDDDDDNVSIASDDSLDSDPGDDSDDEDHTNQLGGKKDDDDHKTQTDPPVGTSTAIQTFSSTGASSSVRSTSSAQTGAFTTTSSAQRTASAPQANAPTSSATTSSSSPKQTGASDDNDDDQSDDEDSDDEDDDDSAVREKKDDLSGKLTNVTVADILPGINVSTRLSTRCVRSLSYPEIA